MIEKVKNQIDAIHPDVKILTHGRRWDIYVSLKLSDVESEGRSSCLTAGVGYLPLANEYNQAIKEALKQAQDILYYHIMDVYQLAREAIVLSKEDAPPTEGLERR